MRRIHFIFLYGFIIRPFLRWIVGIKFSSNAIFKCEPQFIIVANHNSHLDTAAILSSLPLEKIHRVHPTAAGDYFKSKFIRTIVSLFFNAVFIRRGSLKGLDDMQELLNAGESLIIYPEGTRGAPEVMQQFKRGVGLLVKNNPQIPYIPCYLKGMGRVMPRNDGLVVPFSGVVKIGNAYRSQSDDIDNIVDEIFLRLLELKDDY